MGILNVTPDSFSDGGSYIDPGSAVQRALEMAREGADVIDIGGESTRPFADNVPLEEEIRRVVPVIRGIRNAIDIPISVETSHSEVALAALEAGATFINDVNALRGEGMEDLVASSGVSAVIMHMKGTPKDMQVAPVYEDVVSEVRSFLSDRLVHLDSVGVDNGRIIIDPGIGFGKRLEDNLSILRDLDSFLELGCPVLVGASRKSFIGSVTGSPVEDRLEGSIAAAVIAAIKGASMVRVHDVVQTRKALDMVRAIYGT